MIHNGESEKPRATKLEFIAAFEEPPPIKIQHAAQNKKVAAASGEVVRGRREREKEREAFDLGRFFFVVTPPKSQHIPTKQQGYFQQPCGREFEVKNEGKGSRQNPDPLAVSRTGSSSSEEV
eukprot:RCo020048